MRRCLNILVLFSIILTVFMPITYIKADTNTYSVVSIKSDGSINEIGSFSDYNSAYNKMNEYNSNMDDVAVIKNNGKIIYAKYGIFRPSDSNTILKIYSSDGTYLGYISPAYNSDTLFLDYNSSNNMVKIKISGLTGWVSLDSGSIHPISYLTDGDNLSYDTSKKYVKILYQNGIRLREGPGTDYKQIGCNGANTCSSSSGGIWATGDAIYEWLNYGNVTNDGTYDWYQVNINGNIGYIGNEVATNDLEEYNPSLGNKQTFSTYYYVNSSGELYHSYYVSAVSSKVWYTRLGKAPLYLKQGVNYYSFDGNYFYDDFTKMVNDLRSGNYNNAVNKMPYYNYYQYLPTRTQTNYNADNLNDYIGYNSKIDRSLYYELVYDESTQKYKWKSYGDWDSFPSGQSMLYGEGESFIESQEKYGVNAAQTLAIAITESGWGRSYMSVREYNIFGHGAFDTAPDEYAASYESISAGIMAHAFKYIAKDYANPVSGYNYNGSHYGNKLSGNNVSYASDAYWGEKMAGNYYSIDKNFGFQDFNQRKTLGIKQSAEAAPVYQEPNTNSVKYYNLKNRENIPVTILDTVIGEEIDGNNIWYKIQSDVPIDENRNLVDINLGTYNFDTSYAYIHSSYIYKESNEPIIYASDLVLKNGTKFDSLSGVTAYDAWDGDLTDKIKVVENNVNTSKAGDYVVTYKVVDSENNETLKSINVTVLSSKPEISASDKTINIRSNFDPLSGITASDAEDGDITKNIKVEKSDVDITKTGTYEVKYSVTDSDNNTVTKTIKVTVISNKPVIDASNITYVIGDEFNPMSNVLATDVEDGDITKSVTITKNTVEVDKVGTYSIIYSVTDKDNNTVTKKISVMVIEKNLEEKDAIFYLDYIKNVDGKLQIKGYNTINGINNTLDENINYEVVFINIDTNKTYTQKATRITDKNEMSRPAVGLDDMDYTYSWFKLDVDLENLPSGNYQMKIVSKSSKYKSTSIISNKLYKTQDTYFEGDKTVITRNNFDDKKGPIELIIRDNVLAKKSSSSVYNQYDTYRIFEFTNDGLLHLKGVSYSYGMDLSSSKNVKREIIFENINDYNLVYRYQLDSTTDGLYNVVLPVDDNLSKDKAWYDKTFDITNIPVGRYVIYIATESNITDIAEFTEKLNRDISNITLTHDDKKYRFEINQNRGNRIELVVENV